MAPAVPAEQAQQTEETPPPGSFTLDQLRQAQQALRARVAASASWLLIIPAISIIGVILVRYLQIGLVPVFRLGVTYIPLWTRIPAEHWIRQDHMALALGGMSLLVFGGLWWWARRGHIAPFVIAMVLYTADGWLCYEMGIRIHALVHLVGLVFLGIGLGRAIQFFRVRRFAGKVPPSDEPATG